MFADDANSVKVAGYAVTDLRGRYRYSNTDTYDCTISLALDNVFDTQYNDNVRINAFGARAFEPAGGRLARISLEWVY